MIDDFPYYREVIARVGMEDRMIVPEAKRVAVRAPEILFSSNIAGDFRHPAHYCSGWAIDGLRRIMGVEDLPARRGRKLLISRADAKGRAVVNWDELLPVFARHGFETVELTGLPLAEQMALFRDAAQVVGSPWRWTDEYSVRAEGMLGAGNLAAVGRDAGVLAARVAFGSALHRDDRRRSGIAAAPLRVLATQRGV